MCKLIVAEDKQRACLDNFAISVMAGLRVLFESQDDFSQNPSMNKNRHWCMKMFAKLDRSVLSSQVEKQLGAIALAGDDD